MLCTAAHEHFQKAEKKNFFLGPAVAETKELDVVCGDGWQRFQKIRILSETEVYWQRQPEQENQHTRNSHIATKETEQENE